jgi:hypothetical protein
MAVRNVRVGDVIINASGENNKSVVGSPYGRMFVADIIKVKEIDEDGYCKVETLWSYSFTDKHPINRGRVHKESAFMSYGHKIQSVPRDTIKLILNPEKFRSKHPESGIYLEQ